MICFLSLLTGTYSANAISSITIGPDIGLMKAIATAKDENTLGVGFFSRNTNNVAEFFKKNGNNINNIVLTWDNYQKAKADQELDVRKDVSITSVKIICAGFWNETTCSGEQLLLEVQYAKAGNILRARSSHQDAGFTYQPLAVEQNQTFDKFGNVNRPAHAYFQKVNRTLLAAIGLNRDENGVKEFFRGKDISGGSDLESESNAGYVLRSLVINKKVNLVSEEGDFPENSLDVCVVMSLNINLNGNDVKRASVRITQKELANEICHPGIGFGLGY